MPDRLCLFSFLLHTTRPCLCRFASGGRRHLDLLLRSEPEEMIVRRLSQRPQGGSGNNPFLKPNRTQMEYTVLIEPQSIARKIMQVCCACVTGTAGGGCPTPTLSCVTPFGTSK